MCPTPRLKLNFFGRSFPYKWMFHRFSDLKVTNTFRINIINRSQNMECDKKCDAVFNTASCRQHEQVGKFCKKPATHLHKCNNERNRSAIKLLRMSVQVVHHSQSLLNIFNQLHMQKQRRHKPGNVDFNIWRLNREFIHIKNYSFYNHYDETHLNQVDPETSVKVSSLHLLCHLKFLLDVFCVRYKRDSIEILC